MSNKKVIDISQEINSLHGKVLKDPGLYCINNMTIGEYKQQLMKDNNARSVEIKLVNADDDIDAKNNYSDTDLLSDYITYHYDITITPKEASPKEILTNWLSNLLNNRETILRMFNFIPFFPKLRNTYLHEIVDQIVNKTIDDSFVFSGIRNIATASEISEFYNQFEDIKKAMMECTFEMFDFYTNKHVVEPEQEKLHVSGAFIFSYILIFHHDIENASINQMVSLMVKNTKYTRKQLIESLNYFMKETDWKGCKSLLIKREQGYDGYDVKEEDHSFLARKNRKKNEVVLDKNCQNIMKYIIKNKKTITYRQYEDLWNDPSIGITQQEVDKCLRNNHIRILPNPNIFIGQLKFGSKIRKSKKSINKSKKSINKSKKSINKSKKSINKSKKSKTKKSVRKSKTKKSVRTRKTKK